jgi:hypothetical protein
VTSSSAHAVHLESGMARGKHRGDDLPILVAGCVLIALVAAGCVWITNFFCT